MSLALMLLIVFITGAGFGYFMHVTIGNKKRRKSKEEELAKRSKEMNG